MADDISRPATVFQFFEAILPWAVIFCSGNAEPVQHEARIVIELSAISAARDHPTWKKEDVTQGAQTGEKRFLQLDCRHKEDNGRSISRNHDNISSLSTSASFPLFSIGNSCIRLRHSIPQAPSLAPVSFEPFRCFPSSFLSYFVVSESSAGRKEKEESAVKMMNNDARLFSKTNFQKDWSFKKEKSLEITCFDSSFSVQFFPLGDLVRAWL